MKIYIASPFFTEDQLSVVKKIEGVLGSLGIEFFSPRHIGVIKEMTAEEKKNKMHHIYKSNVDNIRDCKSMIVVLDWHDTGTIFELGYAAALKELSPSRFDKIITFTDKSKAVNLMLRYAIDCHAIGCENLKDQIDIFKKEKTMSEEMKNFPEVSE
tara:strand:+ start:131 stop:598 length:468 start_codon:yes stop_codon:yes gene_type:complete